MNRRLDLLGSCCSIAAAAIWWLAIDNPFIGLAHVLIGLPGLFRYAFRKD